ncbi:quinoprotein relay system zinc metallohydrolase 1 [Amphritea japonica]|uniref:Beta-lactamase domain-containing protein n=1 Tax=Amphritea japonica ATCC BAA-1530 TaxID=1278309 RepID=A0A7R6PK94_9GAMM|nr:quinoprotein relay system zinc metallohydrolase 1 [Amphritea japonica]BBB25910.1 beta-lactamase domain-containing protein [Amphritea japonica ATCC BAA-1530]
MKSLLAVFLLVLCSSVYSAPLEYNLTAQEIASGTWVVEGKQEDFSRANGGNIVNTAFVVTGDGVVLIDTGPSLRYGTELRQLIGSVTDQPIRFVLNTHHHPDHFLGNQAFKDSSIYALPDTGKLIAQQGNAFAENMYRMVGDWMRSTEVHLPDKPLTMSRLVLGEHRFRFLSMTGHAGADLVVLDETTGVLFAADIVFYQRALTTPHTPDLKQWIADLTQLEQLNFQWLVPGHGPVSEGTVAIVQMRDYLTWLDKRLSQAAEQGLSMNEVIELPLDSRFAGLAVARKEYIRSVAHLYERYENAMFQ